jgi:hypothetical protein
METYRFYPPQLRPTQVPYQVLASGANDCEHEVLARDMKDSMLVQDGLIFVTFSCKHCGRQVCQSLEEVLPPASWKGGQPARTNGSAG